MASPVHCIVCDCRAKSQQRPTPSAYGCQSRMMSQTPYRQKGRLMRYRKTLLLIRHSYSNGNVKVTQRDVHNKQLRAPVFAPDLMTTQVSSETQSVSPPFSPLEGEPHTSSSADHDTCTSSVQACSAISRLSRHILSCYLRLQISGLHKNMISP